MSKVAEIWAAHLAQVDACKTANGGWTKEDLAKFGVPWPPPQGWREAIGERGLPYMAAPAGTRIVAQYMTKRQRVLAGEFGYRVRPLSDTEAAQFYWCSDIKTPEIVDAYPAYDIGEAEIVGALCTDCRGPLIVKSRHESENWLPGLQIGHNHLYLKCKPCHKKFIDNRDAPFREEMRQREARQNELRFMPYADYLQTPEWQETRQSALKRAGFKCQTCSAGGSLHVHHRTYIRRGVERASDLIVLCAACHQLFHENGKLAEGGRAA